MVFDGGFLVSLLEIFWRSGLGNAKDLVELGVVALTRRSSSEHLVYVIEKTLKERSGRERLSIEFCCVAAVVLRRLIEFAYYVQVFVGAAEHSRTFYISFFLFKTLFCFFYSFHLQWAKEKFIFTIT